METDKTALSFPISLRFFRSCQLSWLGQPAFVARNRATLRGWIMGTAYADQNRSRRTRGWIELGLTGQRTPPWLSEAEALVHPANAVPSSGRGDQLLPRNRRVSYLPFLPCQVH